MSFRLPLFPLGVVLFPGAMLPLHIFEPRYRRLLADILEGDGRFGLLLPGIAHEAPSVGAIGCVAELRGSHVLPDGRSNIVVEGGTRFLLTRYIDETTPYLVGMVEAFEDREGTSPPASQAVALTDALQRYLPLLRELNGMDPDTTPLPQGIVELSFYAAAAVECDLGDKQRMLEGRSTEERVSLLLRLLPPLSLAVQQGLRQRQRAGLNGKGSHPPADPA
jgi:Lon protease-like protein